MLAKLFDKWQSSAAVGTASAAAQVPAAAAGSHTCTNTATPPRNHNGRDRHSLTKLVVTMTHAHTAG